MRSTLRSLFILLGCCLLVPQAARPQSQGRGLSLIVLPDEGSAAELRAKIRAGQSFETSAILKSTDPTADRGGYMGVVNDSSLRQEFRDALEGLSPGQVSRVARVGDDFVLLKWTNVEEDAWRSQNDSAISALQQGRYSEAAERFVDAVRRAEKLGIDDVRLAESLNGLAQTYRFQQNYATAEPRARQSLGILERALGDSHPGVLPSLVNLANISRGAQRNAEAEEFYRRILSIRWGTTEIKTVRADQVLEQLAKVLYLGYARDSNLEKELQEYWRLIAESSINKELYAGMRELLLAVPLMPVAESLMQQAVRLNPDSRQLRYQLGEVYAKWEKYESAIGVLGEAVRLNAPLKPELDRKQRALIYSTIAQMNFYLVRFDDAFAALTKALELNPDSGSSRLLLGALYLRRNKFEEAAAEYKRVIAANALDADAHEGIAQVGLALGRYSESVRDADKALKIKPELQSARYLKAMALIRDGHQQEGRAALEEYERFEADRRVADSRTAEIREIDLTSSALLADGHPEEAIQVLRKGIQAHPLNAALHRRLGLCQVRLGLHRDAVDTFATMVRLKPDDFLVHWQLSREYEALGQQDSARQQRVIYLQKYDAALQANEN